jgi:hypothetical protein
MAAEIKQAVQIRGFSMDVIQIFGIESLPIIKTGDNLAELICEAAKRQGNPIQDGDIIVITHVIVSRAEGNVVNLDEVTPSEFAKNIAMQYGEPMSKLFFENPKALDAWTMEYSLRKVNMDLFAQTLELTSLTFQAKEQLLCCLRIQTPLQTELGEK